MSTVLQTFIAQRVERIPCGQAVNKSQRLESCQQNSSRVRIRARCGEGGMRGGRFVFFQYMHFENKVRNTVTVPYSENVDTSGSTMPACAAYNYLTNDC